MMTSASTSPLRLTKIDNLTRPDHSYLLATDQCYFLGEYTARRGFTFSPTNNLVFNFKKSVSLRGTTQWQWKELAIKQVAAAFQTVLPDRFLNEATLIPVPPSKAKSDPLHDDRLIRMLQAIRPEKTVDVREIVLQSASSEAVHRQEVRPRPEEIIARYTIDWRLAKPAPRVIAICDDVLTTGAHYRAVHSVLRQIFPETKMLGIFIARRAPETADFSDFDTL